MLKTNKKQLTKNDISNSINLKTGMSKIYSNEITDNLIFILKNLIKSKDINIKNFGSFKTLQKKERIGRNPKNKTCYIIKARKSLVFKIAKNFSTKINNI